MVSFQVQKNNKLKKFFNKDPNYRENTKKLWGSSKATIAKRLEDCSDIWCIKHKIDKSILTRWTYPSRKILIHRMLIFSVPRTSLKDLI